MKNKKLKDKAKKTAKAAKIAAKKGANKAKETIKKNPTGLFAIVAIAIGGYVLYKATTSVTGLLPDTSDDPDAGGGDLTVGNDNVITGATISSNQAQIAAAGLLQAMNGFGTSVNRIYTILGGRTSADFTLISQAFGTPRYDGAGEGFWPAAKRSLTYWLNAELSRSEIAELKQVMPNVL